MPDREILTSGPNVAEVFHQAATLLAEEIGKPLSASAIGKVVGESRQNSHRARKTGATASRVFRWLAVWNDRRSLPPFTIGGDGTTWWAERATLSPCLPSSLPPTATTTTEPPKTLQP